MIPLPTRRMTSRQNNVVKFLRTGTAYAALLGLVVSAGVVSAETPEQRAWAMLRSGVSQKNTAKRVQAVRALRLLPGEPEAKEMAENALRDRNPNVRVTAAVALGLMGAKEAIPAMKKATSDEKPAVVLAAAHSLELLHDPAGDQVYYAILTGERKPAEGLLAQQIDTLKDKKKMAKLGFEEGIGLVPYGDIGFSAAKAIRKDDASPVRATAARALIKDSDPRVAGALVQATSDKSWIVRASAVLALAKREDPDVLPAVIPALSDKNQVVRFTAAAAVIRLTTVAARNKDMKDTNCRLGSKPTDPGCVNALSVRKNCTDYELIGGTHHE
jgi:HEAT repeat protein